MYSKIVNPQTGRKVFINGILGKSILKKYLTVLSGGSTAFRYEHSSEDSEDVGAIGPPAQLLADLERQRVSENVAARRAETRRKWLAVWRALHPPAARAAARTAWVRDLETTILQDAVSLESFEESAVEQRLRAQQAEEQRLSMEKALTLQALQGGDDDYPDLDDFKEANLKETASAAHPMSSTSSEGGVPVPHFIDTNPTQT